VIGAVMTRIFLLDHSVYRCGILYDSGFTGQRRATIAMLQSPGQL